MAVSDVVDASRNGARELTGSSHPDTTPSDDTGARPASAFRWLPFRDLRGRSRQHDGLIGTPEEVDNDGQDRRASRLRAEDGCSRWGAYRRLTAGQMASLCTWHFLDVSSS